MCICMRSTHYLQAVAGSTSSTTGDSDSSSSSSTSSSDLAWVFRTDAQGTLQCIAVLHLFIQLLRILLL
jgi:hypothetical protein